MLLLLMFENEFVWFTSEMVSIQHQQKKKKKHINWQIKAVKLLWWISIERSDRVKLMKTDVTFDARMFLYLSLNVMYALCMWNM